MYQPRRPQHGSNAILSFLNPHLDRTQSRLVRLETLLAFVYHLSITPYPRLGGLPVEDNRNGRPRFAYGRSKLVQPWHCGSIILCQSMWCNSDCRALEPAGHSFGKSEELVSRACTNQTA
jgi:hypothetical protein